MSVANIGLKESPDCRILIRFCVVKSVICIAPVRDFSMAILALTSLSCVKNPVAVTILESGIGEMHRSAFDVRNEAE